VSHQPAYDSSAFGAGVAGVVFDGISSYMKNVTAALGPDSTMFAVFRDDGSSGGIDGPCCSGVVFYDVRGSAL
jgi:hypothetical protein